MVLEKYAAAYPDRFFNVGIAEANMVNLATGLALDGWIPYVYSIATFASMRGYEQIRNGPVLHKLPVRIIGIGGGFSYGHSGTSHYSLEDFSIMRVQPGLGVIAPADPDQTRNALYATYDHPGPLYFRIGKGGDRKVEGLNGRFSMGSVEIVGSGREVLLLSTGGMACDVAEVANTLGNATVGIVATINPPPTLALEKLIHGFKNVISIEEHYLPGGLSSLVAETIASLGKAVNFKAMGVCEMPEGITGSRNYMLQRVGLDQASLKRKIKAFIERG